MIWNLTYFSKVTFILLIMLIPCKFLFALSSDSKIIESNLPKIIYIIRHGEKPSPEKIDNGNLICQGFIRSLKIPRIFSKLNINILVAPKPNFILADNIATSGQRSFETIIPFSIMYSLPIYAHFNKDGVEDVAKELMNEYKGKTILMAWEHKNISGILSFLGVKNPPIWPDSDFDSVYKVTFDSTSLEPILNTSMKQLIDTQKITADSCKELQLP